MAVNKAIIVFDNYLIVPANEVVRGHRNGERASVCASVAPKHYLNQCWIIIHWPLKNKLQSNLNGNAMIFSCDQAALRTLLSVRRSVCPSICHTFLTMFPSSYHHEIFWNDYQWQKWYPCKRSRSKVKVTEVKTQFKPFPDCNSSLN